MKREPQLSFKDELERLSLFEARRETPESRQEGPLDRLLTNRPVHRNAHVT